MDFIDEVKIEVRAGKGGAGAKHFRREKFVPLGGPDGGDGGDGGSVILQADSSKHTLLDLRFQPHWIAGDGASGKKNNCTGRRGKDVLIQVPMGTQVFSGPGAQRSDESAAPQVPIADLNENGQQVVLARGGRGGKGNNFFKSPTNQAPEHAQPGEEGESGSFFLSLKLLADVGLIGMPNAGKSTFISAISSARPKVADYPFTTLVPHLGVVRTSHGDEFVVADIPGLIPGAHTGKGLGTKFLKHVERTSVLAHLVELTPLLEDSGEEQIIERWKVIEQELQLFSVELRKKKRVVLLTKADLLGEEKKSKAAAVIKKLKKLGAAQVFCISSASHFGVAEAVENLAVEVKSNRNASETNDDEID